MKNRKFLKIFVQKLTFLAELKFCIVDLNKNYIQQRYKSENLVLNFIPSFLPNENSVHWPKYCKYNLIKYAPFDKSLSDLITNRDIENDSNILDDDWTQSWINFREANIDTRCPSLFRTFERFKMKSITI